MNTLRIKLLTPTAKLPTRAHEFDAGLDLFADEPGGFCLEPSDDPTLIDTGIAIDLPPGYQATVLPKSGLSKRGVHVYVGTVDASYRGEIRVCMQLLLDAGTHDKMRFMHGDKIAQLVVTRCELPTPVAVTELSAYGTRGEKGWGSSGR